MHETSVGSGTTSRPVPGGIDARYADVVRLWILRLMIHGNGRRRFVSEHAFNDDSIARLLGFSREEMDFLESFDARAANEKLRQWLRGAEADGHALPQDTDIARNVQGLGREVGLNRLEQDLLHLVVLERNCGELADAFDMIGGLSLDRLCRTLGACIGAEPAQVRAALASTGLLARTSLLNVDMGAQFNFRHKLDILDGLADDLTVARDDLLDLFSRHVSLAPPSTLALDAYPHLQDDLVILLPYLRQAAGTGRAAVNVLLYGPPGTGKTQLVRSLAGALGLRLHEIASAEANGDPRPGKSRFCAYRVAQQILGRVPRAALLFDEIEDVFFEPATERAAREGCASGSKAWVNQMLESNPVPTFWVTNRLRVLDHAFRRRFDYVLEVDVPPRSVRRRMVDRYTAPLPVSDAWRDRLADNDSIAPAVLERTTRVVGLLDVAARVDVERALTRVINNTVRALGGEPLPQATVGGTGGYRLELLNVDCDLAPLRQGLADSGEGRLCLYGPPGTGKTAFGRHLAQALDRPLLLHRASDLLSPYVGEAERNIARMFEQAQREGGVLLLDEADTYLRDRQGAHRGWEVAQVNEMLTQMESFGGVFIASTNLMDTLDAAALRRFDVKIRFDYMTAEQAWAMFCDIARRKSWATPEVLRRELDRIPALTPGDFATLERQLRFARCDTAEAFIERLAAEVRLKPEHRRRPVGF